MVLEDDNLETMVVAISQGRTIYNNLRKSVRYMLSKNASEIMIMFTALAAGMGQPFNVMQLLWINMISGHLPRPCACPGTARAGCTPAASPRIPRNRSSRRRTSKGSSSSLPPSRRGRWRRTVTVSCATVRGLRPARMAFTNFVTAGLLHAISHRSETHSIFDAERLAPNKYLTIALTGSLGVQSLTLLVPGLGSFLGMSPLNPFDLQFQSGPLLLPCSSTKRPKR